MIKKTHFLILLLSVGLFSCGKADVTMQSLLHELTDRAEMAKLPKHNYKLLQASSYDRASKSTDENWFANGDASQFIRIDTTDNGVEYVLLEAEGAGAVVRFWSTFHAKNFSLGKIRIYLDGKTEPQFEGRIDSLIGYNPHFGKVFSSTSGGFLEHGDNFQGFNLYAPIPFAKACRITYQKGTPDANDVLYYNINYRLYDAGVKVESLPAVAQWSAELKKQLAQASQELTQEKLSLGKVHEAHDQAIPAGETFELSFDGPAYIQQISMELGKGKMEQALRNTVLELQFDDEKSVWVPVGEFFGTSYRINPSTNWVTDVKNTGEMIIKLPMPFSKKAHLKLHNLGKETVTLKDLSVATDAWKWDERSLYFHADWNAHPRISTNTKQDLTYNDITGKGKYIGDVLSLYNDSYVWWGEGDEKIYVDGETFPSHFGTGTEDYFGYAWCSVVEFESPFIAQAAGDGNRAPGLSVNARWRLLDQIPFQKSLKMDMELWHWGHCLMDYNSTSYWYGTAGAKSSLKPNRAALEQEIRFPNHYEVEGFDVDKATKGEVLPEAFLMDGWSGRFHLLWRQLEKGAELNLSFLAYKEQSGRLKANFTYLPSSVIVDLYLNDKLVYKDLNTAGDRLSTFSKLSKATKIQKGRNTVKVVVKELSGKKDGSHNFGLDYLQIVE